MHNALRSRLMLAAFVWVGFASSAPCAEPAPEVPSAEKYRKLIRELVSPNKEPMTRNRSSGAVKFPEDYDVEAQKRIEATRIALRDNFESALPYLVDALNDDRYCMTIDFAEGQAYYNFSVGEICRDVIASQLEVYRGTLRFSDVRHWHQYNYPVSKEWLETRKGRGLVELQVEAIDWAISRRHNEASGEDAMNQVVETRKLRDTISTTRKPAPPRRMLPMVTSNRGNLP